MKRVYCLYRVSTKGQVDKDDIPMQKTSCRKFAERNGWTILKEFQEKRRIGIQGFGKRPRCYSGFESRRRKERIRCAPCLYV